MQENTKNKIITIGFCIILLFTLIANIISKDKKISITERRKLAQFPEITINKILSGNVMNRWEKYVEDQFVQRDLSRKIKTFWSLNVFKNQDNNKLFEKDGAIYKMEYPLNESNIKKSVKKIQEVYKKYMKNMKVYYSIIPEKNYYLKNDNHLKIDNNKVKQIMNEELKELVYIDIVEELSLDDYYKTDIHWKQEKLNNVVNKISINMGKNKVQENYEISNKGNFYGSYYGQLGINVEPDNLFILENETTKESVTYNFETNEVGKIYDEKKSMDKYDIFLSGPTPLISIENKKAQTDKELLLFRDSFGSSIAPLLIENYSKITLIDLRYISNELLEKYIDFNNQDVLFLYSVQVLNQNVLK